MNQRASGILLHPTSLSNRYPIGDVGPAAIAFADFMASSGQRWWQMLPIKTAPPTLIARVSPAVEINTGLMSLRRTNTDSQAHSMLTSFSEVC